MGGSQVLGLIGWAVVLVSMVKKNKKSMSTSFGGKPKRLFWIG